MTKQLTNIGTVYESAPNLISVKIDNDKIFEENKEHIQIGKYIQIKEGNHNYVLAVIKAIKISSDGEKDKYIINGQPIGLLTGDNCEEFYPGGVTLPSPTENVYIASEEVLINIFKKSEQFSFELGKLVQNKNISLNIDGNKFFSKHVAIVGSTGSGKSCTVSKILQDVVGINDGRNGYFGDQRNSHIILFDIHSEYQNAFTINEEEKFNLNVLDVEKLKLPYWLMNSEELESLFIESNEKNSHNQISQFKNAVILNKEKHNPSLKKITYDTPVYFSIEEVFNYIFNLNEEVINKIEDEDHLPKLGNGTLIENRAQYFEEKYTFFTANTTKNTKASKGPFNGEFDRFLSRLETKLNDKRLNFILNSLNTEEKVYKTDDFEDILKQFLGYLNKANVTIIDLSGIPFEVLSITVSLISRLVFDFAFHYSKLKHEKDKTNDIPFMIVCEEAHNYIPKSAEANYKASKKSIERIAKEGRKYGLSLMVVSQRPSEVSDTIFAQCNNFVALRLTNVHDQSYIKNLLPDNSSAVADVLPILGAGECLVVGDATPIPAVVKLDLPNPLPKSESVKFHKEWNKKWIDVERSQITFKDVIKRWKKE